MQMKPDPINDLLICLVRLWGRLSPAPPRVERRLLRPGITHATASLQRRPPPVEFLKSCFTPISSVACVHILRHWAQKNLHAGKAITSTALNLPVEECAEKISRLWLRLINEKRWAFLTAIKSQSPALTGHTHSTKTTGHPLSVMMLGGGASDGARSIHSIRCSVPASPAETQTWRMQRSKSGDEWRSVWYSIKSHWWFCCGVSNNRICYQPAPETREPIDCRYLGCVGRSQVDPATLKVSLLFSAVLGSNDSDNELFL